MKKASVFAFYLFFLSASAAPLHVARDTVSYTSYTPECTIAALSSLLSANATIINATYVPDGGSYGDPASDFDFPAIVTGLPELCAVEVNVTRQDSSFKFGLYLPAHWSGRLVGTGNTGFGGGINWPFMKNIVFYQAVAFSTDTGHNSNPADGSWALNDDEKLIDWGYRAMHESLAIAKDFVKSYYEESISYSY